MAKQKTLKKAFHLKGKGLHTGQDVTISLGPAPENFGYKICRTDVSGAPLITARAENVVSTERGTVLSQNGVQAATVEHALAALYACGIDNCLIKIDAPEFPILDGSAVIFMQGILQVGAQIQDAERVYYTPEHLIEYHDETSGAHLVLLPSDKLEIHTQIYFDSEVLNVQSAAMHNISEFMSDIAPCRTFVFIKEIEALLQKGLIKGGDLDNAIVIYDRKISQDKFDELATIMHVKKQDAQKLGYIMNTPLRFANEPARHKILDIIGDISLTGKFIKGHIIAICPGHRVNNQFARLISEDIRKSDYQQKNTCRDTAAQLELF